MKALSLFNLNLEAFQLPCAGLSWEGVWLVQMLLPFLYPACCILHFVISYASGPVSDSARAAHSPHASHSSPLAPLPRYRYLLSFMARPSPSQGPSDDGRRGGRVRVVGD